MRIALKRGMTTPDVIYNLKFNEHSYTQETAQIPLQCAPTKRSRHTDGVFNGGRRPGDTGFPRVRTKAADACAARRINVYNIAERHNDGGRAMEYSFGPLIDENSKILILGSLPGVRSLAEARYYAHPQNKFWKIIYGAWGETPDEDFDARYRFILAHGLALWDVVKCAEREGSADGSIRNETPNDIPALLAAHPNVRRIIFNGGFAFAKYKKYFGAPTIDYRKVLSTSPACAGRDREREEMWMEALGR